MKRKHLLGVALLLLGLFLVVTFLLLEEISDLEGPVVDRTEVTGGVVQQQATLETPRSATPLQLFVSQWHQLTRTLRGKAPDLRVSVAIIVPVLQGTTSSISKILEALMTQDTDSLRLSVNPELFLVSACALNDSAVVELAPRFKSIMRSPPSGTNSTPPPVCSVWQGPPFLFFTVT